MVTHYGGFSAFDIMYDPGGHLVDQNAEADLVSAVKNTPDLTDVVLISHGWNNNIDEARALYANYFAQVRGVLNSKLIALPGTEFIIGAVFWPSKRFTAPTLIPGGAASTGSGPAEVLIAQLNDLKEVFPDAASIAALEHACSQIPNLEVSQSAQDDFIASLVSLMPLPREPRDEGLDDARDQLASLSNPGHVVLKRLSIPIMPVLPGPIMGGAASLAAINGGADSIFTNITGGITSAASNFANVLTYYTMKDRAGIVGATGVAPTIERLRAARASLRVHLIGHSFGGRLVTAAANALPAGGAKVASMTLLEAAYSHNGLAKQWDGISDGSFRSVVSARKVQGPILISHSAHDFPVGTCYPIASRIMNQVAAAIGGPDDKFGGMGRNGAQHTPESVDDTLHPLTQAYDDFENGKWIRNLNGDGPPPAPTITSHGDVAKPELAYAWLVGLEQNVNEYAKV